MAELVFFRRGDEVLRFTLDERRVVLGRGEKCDVVIPDPEVSRQQLAVSFEGGQAVLEDLSGKGTLVAGAPVERAPLADGADIALGQWRAIYRERSSGDSDQPTEVNGRATQLQPKDAAAQKWTPAQLRVRQGVNESIHKLIGDAITIGKDPSNDLVLDDRFISGRHLKITRKDATFQVVDTPLDERDLPRARAGVRDRGAALHHAPGRRDRALARAEPGGAEEGGRLPGDGRERPLGAPARRADRPGRAELGRGRDLRRERHRQGARRPRGPREERPRRQAVHPGELRGDLARS